MLGTRKAPSLSEDYPFVCSLDSAVDASGEDFSKVWQSYVAGDIAAPPLKSGEEPTEFILRHFSNEEIAHLENLASKDVEGMIWAAGKMAIRSVRNFRDGDGGYVQVGHVANRDGFLCIDAATVERLPREAIRQCGVTAWTRSKLTPKS